MRINFVLPVVSMSGGIKVAVIYAKLLADKGHEVFLISPSEVEKPIRQKIKSLLLGKGWPKAKSDNGYLRDLNLKHRELEIFRPVTDQDLPDADVVIATWWETAEWVNALSPSKGAKIYFIQHYERFEFLPQDRCDETYRIPAHKIVIAKWLLNLMKDKFNDYDVDLVSNSVDKQQFYAVERDKQAVPTIGFLYAFTHFKGVDVTLQVIRKLKDLIPNLQVVSFGSYMPNNFPLWDNSIKFYHSPDQDKIRDIYAQCDVWITASRSEGFNLPAMEAMACRTPVVSTRTGWPEEAIIDGYNGFLTNVDDVDELVSASKNILLENNLNWKIYSNNAYKTLDDSSWEASAQLFERALNRGIEKAIKVKMSDEVYT